MKCQLRPVQVESIHYPLKRKNFHHKPTPLKRPKYISGEERISLFTFSTCILIPLHEGMHVCDEMESRKLIICRLRIHYRLNSNAQYVVDKGYVYIRMYYVYVCKGYVHLHANTKIYFLINEEG